MSIDAVKTFEPLFGSWYVKEQLGKGSFGEVYLIEREDALGIRSQSALKYMHVSPYMASSSTLNMDNTTNGGTYYDEIAQDIVKEIKIMSSLKGCSNIVSYEDHDCIPAENGQGWDIIIRMELLTSLNDYVKNHQMTEQDTIRLGIDICNALTLCEANGIIHRDIKPGNIMISDTGSFKLGDFGIARTVERGTMGGFSRKGTAPYMAPEIYRGEQYSDSVDIYSLGIVMYQLLNNGRIPFMPPYPDPIRPADEENAMFRRLNGEAIPAPANGSADLQTTVLRACAFQPQDRYPSAAQMKAELEKLLVEPSQRSGHQGAVRDAGDHDADPPPPRKKTWIIAAIIAVVIALAATLIILLSKGKGGDGGGGSQPTTPPTSAPTDTAQPKHTDEPVSGDPTDEPREETSAELVWSEWVDQLPEGVTGDNYAIKSRQVYRSTELITLIGNEEPPEDHFVLLDQEYSQEWSEKIDGLPPAGAGENVQVFSTPITEWTDWIGPITVYDRGSIPNNSETMRVEILLEVKNAGKGSYYKYKYKTLETVGTKYQYRIKKRISRYYNDDGWSPFTDSFIPQEDGILVETKSQYSYAKTDAYVSEPSMDNFSLSDADYRRHYFDVAADAWYSPENSNMLKTVDELGILLPDSHVSFRPDEMMTVGQLIRAAVIINRLYNGYTGLICENNGQYQAYVDYAEKNHLIDEGEFNDLDLTREATRQEMAYMFYKALPEKELAPVNDIESITDMERKLKYYNCALTLARAGVISVTEGNTFHPEEGATRAQTAAMIEKLVHKESRTIIS